MKKFITLLTALAFSSVWAYSSDLFWKPKLDGPEAFTTLWRSIKTFGLSHYDILHEGKRYPATELNVNLTHTVILFFYIGPTKDKEKAPSLQEIAEGKFKDAHQLTEKIQGKEPPEKLVIRESDALRTLRFRVTKDKVEILHRELNDHFKNNFPW